MSEKWMPKVEPDAAPGGGTLLAPATSLRDATATPLAAEVEEWLGAEVRSSAPVLWCPRGTVEATVGGADALAGKIARVVVEGEWGVARRTHGWTWAQCMRVDGGWIVEVNGIPGPDCFARRVQVDGNGRRALRGRRRVHDRGRLMATYERAEVIGSAEAAGEIMWSWLRGALPAGYHLQDISG